MTSEGKCPVCGLQLSEQGHDGDLNQYNCINCGKYSLVGTVKAILPSHLQGSPNLSAIISHAIRRMQRVNEWPVIDSYVLNKIEEEGFLPNPAEQAENLVIWLGENLASPGLSRKLHWEYLRAVIGANSDSGVAFIVKSLMQKGLLEGDIATGYGVATLSFEGWELFDKLKRKTSIGASAFMAMDYGNQILTNIFVQYLKDAVKQTGFKLIRLDEQPRAGLIDERLRVEIRRSRLLIADLTNGNAGAYWEAGFAEALNKPVIYTCEQSVFDSKGTHFDTNHQHTILWGSEKPSDFAEELKATIRATIPDEAKMSDSD